MKILSKRQIDLVITLLKDQIEFLSTEDACEDLVAQLKDLLNIFEGEI